MVEGMELISIRETSRRRRLGLWERVSEQDRHYYPKIRPRDFTEVNKA